MPLEIERKFLLTAFTPPETAVRRRIEQGYIAIKDDGTEVRLRRIGDSCVLGVKRATAGAAPVRVEVERELGEREFDELWPATAGARLVKDRYTVESAGVTVDVDVYRGELAGLLTAEVEFGSEEAAEAFTPPDWFGAEITGVPAYKNQNLAVRGLPES
ncbi:CYTH domain-containing protein [Streptomyces sp. 1114.5]|uniref:CYTH domain-containing protein n=1 Tax=unclassified Streptomyces TaxID=2593676 RepID=UPI000BD8AF79|nr:MULTISPECIES: CYTH domain-containing protein [unclassified Streptomyces]RKT18199.1 CYTH domain-containing protein [Streptomyces sp. 1114.5]SOB84398.1 CYTH domain-containing protein [Streptomyces sp. 1331.2]